METACPGGGRSIRWRRRAFTALLAIGLAVVSPAAAGSPALGASTPAVADRQQPDPSGAPTGAVPAPTGAVKYYVVGYTGSAEREYLFEIAIRTLGDGRRYMEIFDLNRGRRQPDGQRMDDPLVVMPGWILLLPSDASGPDVRVGPLPVFGTSGPGRSADAEPAGAGGASEGLVRTAAIVVVVLALAAAMALLRRNRAVAVPASVRAMGTRAATATRRAATMLRATAARSPRPTGWPGQRPATRAEPAWARQAAPPSEPELGVPPLPRAAPVSPAAPAPPPTPTSSPAQAPSAQLPPSARVPSSAKAPPSTQASPSQIRPLRLVDPASAHLEATVRSGPDRLAVRLVGIRPGTAGFAWWGGPQQRPSGHTVISLGEDGGDVLFIDLAASPDVISLTGAPAGLRRRVQSIAHQLASSGVAMVAVGDVPGTTGTAAVVRPDLVGLLDDRGGPAVRAVFLAAPRPQDVPVIHQLVSQRQPRLILITVGSGPRARWSIDVEPDAPAQVARAASGFAEDGRDVVG